MFHAVPNWRATLEIVAPSKRNCRIAQRIARVPRHARGTHTFSLCSRNVTVRQVYSRHRNRHLHHRRRAGTAAQAASMTSTSTVPCPCAITRKKDTPPPSGRTLDPRPHCICAQ